MNGLTKIPVAWLFSILIVLATVIVFVTDIKSATAINSIKTASLDEKINQMEVDIKQSLNDINRKIDELMTLRCIRK